VRTYKAHASDETLASVYSRQSSLDKEGYKMRTVKASAFDKDYQFQQAKKQARKSEIGRRSGRRGTGAWGVWREAE